MRSTLKCDIILLIDLWGNVMKRKIIYISGAETFNVAEVRTAFEEVRSALNLDKDVLLFGVPVDDFEAAITAQDESLTDSVITSEPEFVAPVIQQESIVSEEKDTTKPKAKKAKVAKKEEVKVESVASETQNTEVTEQQEKVVPILSVLATNQKEVENIPQEKIKDFVEEEPAIDVVQEEIIDIVANDDEVQKQEELADDVSAEMLNDDMPSNSTEKTLEELLETMTPLREDVNQEQHVETVEEPEVTEDVLETEEDDTDDILKKLASEYAEKQDELPRKKNTSRGIQRLKSVLPLPFSRQKKEDPGIMGDLFGWAGIAANDEEFTMPGFFTGVASKK